ncbi:MAG TPA: hypothetical protein VGH93_15065, partial [Solirubrobacteraceae bacterium]
MTDRQRNVFVLTLVVGLIAASVVVIAQMKTQLGLDLKGGVQLVYQGEPTPQTPVVTQTALGRAVDIMRSRVDQLGVSDPSIQTSGGNQITAGLPNVKDTSRAEKLMGTTARLAFYDWEANALTPSGKPVASLLQTQDPNAVRISQGGGAQPGAAGAGSMPLYQAVKLASKQPQWISKTNARQGPEYFMFGAPGSAACRKAAQDRGTAPVVGQWCYLSGPDSNLQDLNAGLPTGVSASEGHVLTVPQGWVVLQAVTPKYGQSIPWGNPTAQYYVLRDNVALFGNDITNPQQSTDQAGSPDVTFGFSGSGKKAFQDVTAQIAQRGSLVSGLGQSLNQHFAVALDNQLVTVPFIDYKQYPDGINGDSGADISGSFTISSAQDLANELRLGALP